MPDIRTVVQESQQSLVELQKQYTGPLQRKRLRMLHFLREDPERSLSDVATLLGCSERSIQRWWQLYRAEGLTALLEAKHRGKPRKIGEAEVDELRRQIQAAGFERIDQIRHWIEERYGVSYSRSGIWYLMRSTLKASPRGWIMLDDDLLGPVSTSSSYHSPVDDQIPAKFVEFLNSLPTSDDILDWGAEFREAFRALLPDVDRISLNVDLHCSLSRPDEYKVGTRVTHFVANSAAGSDPTITVASDRGADTPTQRLLDGLRAQGIPLQNFHPPLTADYYFSGLAYIGTIFLWRSINESPISEHTKAIFSRLEPFIIFALSDIVARHQASKPIDGVFYDALVQMVAEADLSPTEQRIVTLQLMGHSYKDMSASLDVSLDAVKKHLHNVYKKTKTRGMAELFSKYFSARLRIELPEN